MTLPPAGRAAPPRAPPRIRPRPVARAGRTMQARPRQVRPALEAPLADRRPRRSRHRAEHRRRRPRERVRARAGFRRSLRVWR
jgi:hypothetical protein